MAGDPDEVADDVVERDRLRRRRDPPRRDHRGQPVDERDDRLEGRAAPADHDRRADRRHRHAAGGERGGRVEPAAEMGREVGPVVAEAAEVHDLLRGRRARPPRRRRRRRVGRAPRSPPRRASGRGSRRPRRPSRARRTCSASPASAATVRTPGCAERPGFRETATTSPRSASAGTSAPPTNPVAPRTAIFTPRSASRGSAARSRRARGPGARGSARARRGKIAAHGHGQLAASLRERERAARAACQHAAADRVPAAHPLALDRDLGGPEREQRRAGAEQPSSAIPPSARGSGRGRGSSARARASTRPELAPRPARRARPRRPSRARAARSRPRRRRAGARSSANRRARAWKASEQLDGGAVRRLCIRLPACGSGRRGRPSPGSRRAYPRPGRGARARPLRRPDGPAQFTEYFHLLLTGRRADRGAALLPRPAARRDRRARADADEHRRADDARRATRARCRARSRPGSSGCRAGLARHRGGVRAAARAGAQAALGGGRRRAARAIHAAGGEGARLRPSGAPAGRPARRADPRARRRARRRAARTSRSRARSATPSPSEWGRPLTMNVSMPIAAVMLDLGFRRPRR